MYVFLFDHFDNLTLWTDYANEEISTSCKASVIYVFYFILNFIYFNTIITQVHTTYINLAC